MWNLPGPGIEPVSPALAGGFFTTVPPRKSSTFLFNLTEIGKLFSRAAIPFYIPSRNHWEFLFLCILTNICYCLPFWLQSFQWVWSGISLWFWFVFPKWLMMLDSSWLLSVGIHSNLFLKCFISVLYRWKQNSLEQTRFMGRNCHQWMSLDLWLGLCKTMGCDLFLLGVKAASTASKNYYGERTKISHSFVMNL